MCSICMKWKKILTQLYSDDLRHANGGDVDSVLVCTGCSVMYSQTSEVYSEGNLDQKCPKNYRSI